MKSNLFDYRLSVSGQVVTKIVGFQASSDDDAITYSEEFLETDTDCSFLDNALLEAYTSTEHPFTKREVAKFTCSHTK